MSSHVIQRMLGESSAASDALDATSDTSDTPTRNRTDGKRFLCTVGVLIQGVLSFTFQKRYSKRD